MSVLLLAIAAASAASPEPAPRPSATAQATATVRIVSGTEIRFSEVEQTQPARLRETRIKSSDGQWQLARVLEFQ